MAFFAGSLAESFESFGQPGNASLPIYGGDEPTYDCAGAEDFTFFLSWILAILQLPAVYAPQWIKMLKGKTHVGISLPNNICFSLDGLFALLSLLCQTWKPTFGCCTAGHTGWQCGYSMAGFFQTVTAWMGSTMSVVIYFRVFDRAGLVAKGFDASEEMASCKRWAWFLFFVHVVLVIIPISLGLATMATDAPSLIKYGEVMAAAASICIAFHWLLQMYETWRMQTIGGLSIIMCIVSVIGSIATVFAYRSKGWKVYLPYVAGTISITIATIFALWVEWRAKKGFATEWRLGEAPGPADPVSFAGSFIKRRNSSTAGSTALSFAAEASSADSAGLAGNVKRSAASNAVEASNADSLPGDVKR